MRCERAGYNVPMSHTPPTAQASVEVAVVTGKVGCYGHTWKSDSLSAVHDYLIVRAWRDSEMDRDDKIGIARDTLGVTFDEDRPIADVRVELELIVRLGRKDHSDDVFSVLTTDPRWRGQDYLFTY